MVFANAPVATGSGNVPAIGALVRSCQMAGAITEVLNLCVTYAGERVQFERPIGKFQAIQQQLAILAGEAAAAELAAQIACRAVDRGGEAFLEIATAKIRTGEAVGKAAAISHQVFGAIGFTEEHHLHNLTRRLWSWRAEYGTESIWARRLGRAVAEQGADQLWPNLTKTN
jgi:acyl-CoA dehydrogenase